MALRKRTPEPQEVITWDTSKAFEEVPALRSLVAAAAQIKLDAPATGPGRKKVGHLDWQYEGWRLHDIIGELRFAANRQAGALSQVDIYVAELDSQGNPGDRAADERVAELGNTIFGGPAAKGEFLRQIGIQLFIGGESYLIAESVANADDDVWYAVSPRQIKRSSSGVFSVRRPESYGGGWKTLDAKRDLMMRIWTPHPDDYDLADSPTRSVLPICREIERLTQLTFSQIDSRLISAGLLLLPQGITFPGKDGTNGGTRAILEMILDVASAQLQGAGTAAGLVPILAEIPQGTGKDIIHQRFESALQNELKEKLDHAIRRLATGLDISPEEMLGQGASNHWSAHQIGEDNVKLFIAPVMARICDALTQGYLVPALKAMKLDPAKYTVWFDASALAVRPNRFEDAVALEDKGIVSPATVRKAGNFSEDDAPDDETIKIWRAWKAVELTAGAILQDKQYASLLGLPVWTPPTPPPPPPAQPGGGALPGGQGGPQDALPGVDPAEQAAIEGTSVPKTKSDGPSPAQRGLTASAAQLVPGAEQAVLRALELAGGRLLDRHSRGRYSDVPRHEIHTRVRPADRDHARRLVEGAFAHVPALAVSFGVESGELEYLLREYCVELLVRGYAHEQDYLAAALAAARRDARELIDG